MSVPIVWVIGCPSSGKTTLSENIKNKYGYKHVDINAIMQKEIETNSERGVQFAAKLNEGVIVPLADLMPLVEEEVKTDKSDIKGFVIDGYPHNEADAELLATTVGTPDLIIALEVGQETLDTRRPVETTQPTLTPTTFAHNVMPVLEQYAGNAMQIDGNRDAHAIFVEIMPNMETLNQKRGSSSSISS